MRVEHSGPAPRNCAYCGTHFKPRVRDYARFCSAVCRAAQWNIDNPRIRRAELAKERKRVLK